MSRQSMRKAARLAASDTSVAHTAELTGFERVPIGPKFIMLLRAPRDAIDRSAYVHRSQLRLRNSVLSGRFSCIG
jgi:hypothetical protein